VWTNPVRALRIDGIRKSEVSDICAALDLEVETFRCRSLAEMLVPYLWLDCAPLMRFTELADAVVRVLPIWKMKTALETPWASSVTVPVS
jgi:hypothetical protein